MLLNNTYINHVLGHNLDEAITVLILGEDGKQMRKSIFISYGTALLMVGANCMEGFVHSIHLYNIQCVNPL